MPPRALIGIGSLDKFVSVMHNAGNRKSLIYGNRKFLVFFVTAHRWTSFCASSILSPMGKYSKRSLLFWGFPTVLIFCSNYRHLWANCLEKMWEPRRLTTAWAFTACYRDNFIFYLYKLTWILWFQWRILSLSSPQVDLWTWQNRAMWSSQ
jgi:hypothetical protein